ncbi:ElaA protein [Winogradskyella wandonensis]|uniref:ElaA protein n=1 Tax=Winogradskyella wandonensis TaxID=1442586 RepID=A0A4R1KS26_9FLAO|nr:GNAT family N-acetyltransferase [Winogradskyella wandonensis]TCK67855.1 ElaA protein [Winogradskyella wandonensis]
MLQIKIKHFIDLNTKELYDVLQLRSEVFVVEQDCVYQDLDGKDQEAIHVLGYENQQLVAYTRLFDAGFYFNEASIGRVVVAKDKRQNNYGYDIMNASIKAISKYYDTDKITISAQTYLKRFYNNLGFKATGDEYLEDGIPHIKMQLN